MASRFPPEASSRHVGRPRDRRPEGDGAGRDLGELAPLYEALPIVVGTGPSWADKWILTFDRSQDVKNTSAPPGVGVGVGAGAGRGGGASRSGYGGNA